MARLRVRFRFNHGRLGAPMDKLGEFAAQAEKFLRSLSSDLKLEVRKGEWIADNFKNGSFECDAEYGGALTDLDRDSGIDALDGVFGPDPLSVCNKGLVSPFTIMEFAKIGQLLNPDDYFEGAVYREDDATTVPLRKVTYKKTAEIRQLLEAPYVSDGMIQGLFYNWHPGADPRFFNIRSLQSGQLVRCEYRKDFHRRVHDASETEGAVVLVYGTVHWERITNNILRIDVADIEIAEPLTDAEFTRFFGSAPEYTGDMTTDEYIDWLRGDGE